MDGNNYSQGTSTENQALHLMLVMLLIITTPLPWKRTLNLFKIQYFFFSQMIVFLPSYTTSTLIIWLPHSWLDFNDSLLYLFKSHVISTAIKKAGISSEVIKVSNTRNGAWVLLKSTLRDEKEIPSLLPEDLSLPSLWGQETPAFMMMFCLPAKHLKSFFCPTVSPVMQTWISIRKK